MRASRTTQARRLGAAMLAALVLAGPAGEVWAANPEAHTCLGELGLRAARALVAECRQVVTATPSPCRLLSHCRDVRKAIRHGCEQMEDNAPPFCEGYLDSDDDDDDED